MRKNGYLFYFSLLVWLTACNNPNSDNALEEVNSSSQISSSSTSHSSSSIYSSSAIVKSSSSSNISYSSESINLCTGTPDSNQICDPRDGVIYKTVTIGTQTWYAENAHYCSQGSGKCNYSFNGSRWSYSWTSTQWDSLGGLYSARSFLNVCSSGWHVASLPEWQILIDYADNDPKKLWSVESGGTDNFGFNAKDALCWDPYFKQVCSSSWYTSSSGGWYKVIDFKYLNVNNAVNYEFRSVRCIKDSQE